MGSSPGVGFRPMNWSSGNAQQKTFSMLVPPTNANSGGGNFQDYQPTLVVFDGTISLRHVQSVETTKNPVQTGATITDHAYRLPYELDAEVVVSDSMQSFVSGQFSGGNSRSQAAFQYLESLLTARFLLTIAGRLETYDNMLLVRIDAIEDLNNAFALHARLTFQEILLATIQPSSGNPANASARPQTTNVAVSGQGQTQAVPAYVSANNNIANAPSSVDLGPAANVENAGSWSSTNTGSLGSVLN